MNSAREAIRGRMLQIRKDAGLTQEAFVERLNAAARQLYGDDGRRYRQDTLSKIEKPNGQAPTFDDVAIWAAVDPKRRGKLWLGWDEAVDSALVAAPRRQGPSVIQEPPADTFDQPIPATKPGRRQA